MFLASFRMDPVLNITGSRWFQWQGCTGIIAFALGERTSTSGSHESMLKPGTVILQIRLYAMYCLDKRVLALMGITFLASITASATAVGVILAKLTSTHQQNKAYLPSLTELVRPSSNL